MSERSPDDARPPKEEEDLPPLPEDGVRKDLRYSKREDLGVEIKRDLSGSGWLARGDNTRMSKLSFRMGAVPRDYKDPELAALSDPPKREAKPAPEAAKAPEPPPAAPPPPPAEPEKPGAVSRLLGKLFGKGES
jgi:hypothetical protein